MATTKTTYPTTERPAEGFCRHRDSERMFDCGRPVPEDRPHFTWCREHIRAYAQERRAKAPAKVVKMETPTAKPATKAPRRDAQARKSVACPRCRADAGQPCVWSGKAQQRVHADRLRLAEAVTPTK